MRSCRVSSRRKLYDLRLIDAGGRVVSAGRRHAAAGAVGMDLVAVDFDGPYSLPGGDVYRDVAAGLHLDGASADCDVRDLSA